MIPERRPGVRVELLHEARLAHAGASGNRETETSVASARLWLQSNLSAASTTETYIAWRAAAVSCSYANEAEFSAAATR
jgi:hypothetical protein